MLAAVGLHQDPADTTSVRIMKKIITTVAGAVANCVAGHIIDWCLFRVLGLRCPLETQ
jgi:hypothetical protein